MNWIIVNVEDDTLCWSNIWGWTTDDFDTFTDKERAKLNLPIDGEWRQVPWSVQ